MGVLLLCRAPGAQLARPSVRHCIFTYFNIVWGQKLIICRKNKNKNMVIEKDFMTKGIYFFQMDRISDTDIKKRRREVILCKIEVKG